MGASQAPIPTLLYHSRNDTNEYILRKGSNSPIADSGLSFHLNLQWFYDAAPRGGADGLKIIACSRGITVLSLGQYAIIAARDRDLAIGDRASFRVKFVARGDEVAIDLGA